MTELTLTSIIEGGRDEWFGGGGDVSLNTRKFYIYRIVEMSLSPNYYTRLASSKLTHGHFTIHEFEIE